MNDLSRLADMAEILGAAVVGNLMGDSDIVLWRRFEVWITEEIRGYPRCRNLH